MHKDKENSCMCLCIIMKSLVIGTGSQGDILYFKVFLIIFYFFNMHLLFLQCHCISLNLRHC